MLKTVFALLKAVVAFLLVLGAAWGATWLADQPGSFVIRFGDLEIETSLLVGGLVLIVFAALILLVRWTYDMFVSAPGRVIDHVRNRGRRRGIEALSRGMIAAGAGDASAASHEASVAERQLGQVPLTLLLRAQTAQLKGDEVAARRSFEAMLDEPDTEILGLRGLFMLARKAGDARTARALAERAVAKRPQIGWASLALFELQSAAGDFAGALTTLEARRKHKLIERREADRLAAVLRTAQAMGAGEDEPDVALDHALEAHRLAPDLIPAAVIAGRILAEKSEPGRAARIVERTWRASPHPDLATVYAHLRPGDSPRDRLKRVRSLAGKRVDSIEGPIAVARTALEARAFDEARSALQPYLDDQPTQRVCALMAEIEAAEHGDRGRVREWLARAVNAPRDPAWTADGTVSPVWRPISPVTGALDAYEWRVPVTGSLPAAIEALEGTDDERVIASLPPGDGEPAAIEAKPAPDPKPPEDRSEALPTGKPATADGEPTPKPEAVAPGPPAEQAEQAPPKKDPPAERAAEAKPEAAPAPSAVNVIPPLAPDDPGVIPDDEDDQVGGLPTRGGG